MARSSVIRILVLPLGVTWLSWEGKVGLECPFSHKANRRPPHGTLPSCQMGMVVIAWHSDSWAWAREPYLKLTTPQHSVESKQWLRKISWKDAASLLFSSVLLLQNFRHWVVIFFFNRLSRRNVRMKCVPEPMWKDVVHGIAYRITVASEDLSGNSCLILVPRTFILLLSNWFGIANFISAMFSQFELACSNFFYSGLDHVSWKVTHYWVLCWIK